MMFSKLFARLKIEPKVCSKKMQIQCLIFEMGQIINNDMNRKTKRNLLFCKTKYCLKMLLKEFSKAQVNIVKIRCIVKAETRTMEFKLCN